MSSIDSVQHIVATIRSEMATRIKASSPNALDAQKLRAGKAKAGNTTQQQQRMGSLIRQRVKALDPADPKRGRKAFRIFLESVLLSEFGDNLINDPAFYQVVDDVQQAMEQDPQIAQAIGKAVSNLLDT